MNKSGSSIIELLNVPKELTLEFLGTFARFEYALKRAGYVLGNEKWASADWDRFAKEIEVLGPTSLSPVLGCCQCLKDHPPRKQVLRDCRLQWVLRQGDSGSAVNEILLNVRTVRNNVFHGGKFPDGPIDEPLRDEQLVAECLAVLQSLLQLPLPQNVAEHFWSGA
jgi:hypothetical protein